MITKESLQSADNEAKSGTGWTIRRTYWSLFLVAFSGRSRWWHSTVIIYVHLETTWGKHAIQFKRHPLRQSCVGHEADLNRGIVLPRRWNLLVIKAYNWSRIWQTAHEPPSVVCGPAGSSKFIDHLRKPSCPYRMRSIDQILDQPCRYVWAYCTGKRFQCGLYRYIPQTRSP